MLFLVWVCPFILTASKLRVTHRNLEMRHIYNFKGKGELGGLKLLVEEAKNKPLKTQREEPPLSFSSQCRWSTGFPVILLIAWFLFSFFSQNLTFSSWGGAQTKKVRAEWLFLIGFNCDKCYRPLTCFWEWRGAKRNIGISGNLKSKECSPLLKKWAIRHMRKEIQ